MATPLDSSPSSEDPISSGVSISSTANINVTGDLVGRDKITGYTVEQVGVLLQQIRATFQPKPYDGRSPYVGLAAFQERDADRFFGRETLTAELVTRVTTSSATDARAVFVAGPSGSGKSSLVRAGLVPALKKGNGRGSEHWLYETMKPGRAPLDELARVVASFAKSPDAGKDFSTHALKDETYLHNWGNILLRDDATARAVIVIDQFEEIFTQLLPELEKERIGFLNLLTNAATVENGRVLLIFTIRSDFVSNCASYPALNALVNQQFLQVGAMSPDELVIAIARPALQVGLRMDPALVAHIVNDMRGEPGALPLMQFALNDLFDAEKAGGELTLDGYVARGGLRKALERHADAEFEKLDDTEKQMARSVFSGLIEIGRGHEDTKRTANFQDLVPGGVDAAKVHALVRKLADARLITTSQQGDKETVTLAHERLIDAWGWLRRLVDENRDAIALQNQIAEDAQEWEHRERDASYLYTGARLATAQDQVVAKKIALSALAEEFVEAAVHVREIQQRTQRRRVRLTIAGLIAVVLVISTLAIFAGQQQHEAVLKSQVSESRRLVAESARLRDDHFEVALLLGLEALKLDTNFDARNNLITSLQGTQQELTLRGLQGYGSILAFSSDGSTLAFGHCANVGPCSTGEIRLWDVSTGALLREPLKISRNIVSSLAFSPDGSILASGGVNSIRLWEIESGKVLNVLFGKTDSVDYLSFSPDGALLASAGADQSITEKAIRLWDVKSGHEIAKLAIARDDSVVWLSFSPDGAKLVSAMGDNSIRIWDVATRKELNFRLSGHTASVDSIAISKNGTMLISESCGEMSSSSLVFCVEREIRFWDLATGNQQGLSRIRVEVGDYWHRAVLSSGGGMTAIVDDKAIGVWNTGTGKLLQTEKLRTNFSVLGLTFSPDEKILAASSNDGTIQLWNVVGSSSLEINGVTELGGAVQTLAISPDGKFVAVGTCAEVRNESCNRGQVGLFEVATGKWLSEPIDMNLGLVRSVAFSPDGRILASGSSDQKIQLWNVRDGKLQKGVQLRTRGPINSLTFSPDGKTLVSASCGTGYAGSRCGDAGIQRWNVASGQIIGEPLWGHISGVNSVVFSPDGKLLASGSSDGTVRLWDMTSAKMSNVPLIGHSDPVSSVQFSPDGKMLASASGSKIWLWDAFTGTSLGAPLSGHTKVVNSLVFSPDAKTLVSGSADATIRFWDLSNHKQLGLVLNGHIDSVNSVAFSPGGKFLLSGSTDKTIRKWESDFDHDSLRERVCRLVNRNMTRAEYGQYLNSDPAAYDILYTKNPTCSGLAIEPLPTPISSPTP